MDKPDDGSIQKKSLVDGLQDCAIITGRGNLTVVLYGSGELTESDREYRELAITTLTKVVEELRRIQCPKELDAGLRNSLICNLGIGLMAISKSSYEVIKTALGMLKEIQTIEETAEEDKRDPMYEPMLKNPLVHLMSDLETRMQIFS